MHVQIITPSDIMILYKLSTDTSLSHIFSLLFLFPPTTPTSSPLPFSFYIFFFIFLFPMLKCSTVCLFPSLKISLEAINTACALGLAKRVTRHDLFMTRLTRNPFTPNPDTTRLTKQVETPDTTRPVTCLSIHGSCLTGQHDPLDPFSLKCFFF
jgi:hypothetical protein